MVLERIEQRRREMTVLMQGQLLRNQCCNRRATEAVHRRTRPGVGTAIELIGYAVTIHVPGFGRGLPAVSRLAEWAKLESQPDGIGQII
jgi:hypothetical protein